MKKDVDILKNQLMDNGQLIHILHTFVAKIQIVLAWNIVEIQLIMVCQSKIPQYLI